MRFWRESKYSSRKKVQKIGEFFDEIQYFYVAFSVEPVVGA
jgi:hypothetical protein